MNDVLKPLLENELLNDEAKEQIKEAFEKHMVEVRSEVETELREEFAGRYEHDKGVLVEAVERMVTEGLQAEIAEFVSDRKALTEQRVKLANEIREARIDAKKKLAEQTKVLEAFILENLKKELSEFAQDRRAVKEEKKNLAKQIREARVSYNKKLAEHIAKVETFILGKLKEEIGEFHADKKALTEQRVKMIREGKAKIDETRKEFIRRSAKLVESKVEDALRNEMTQFRDDIERSRKNAFGSQLFEAFAAEFQASFFNEKGEIKKLRTQVEEANTKLAEAAKLFEASQKIAKDAEKRTKLAESRALRTSTMNELLGKLNGKQREVMAELLEGVKTENLRESFKKYIPAVTNGNGSTLLSRRTSATTQLNEGNRKVVTGDKTNKLTESVKSEEDEANNAEILNLQRLAGIQ